MVQYKPEIPFYVVESGRLHLYEAEKRMHRAAFPEGVFRDVLLKEFDAGALVIWDLPPTLSLINDNVLLIADYIVIPTHTDFLSLTGIGNLLAYLDHFRGQHQVKCRLLGIAVTLHRENVTQNRLNRESLAQRFPDLVFPTAVPLSTAIATAAQNHLTPLEASDPRAREAYASLVREIHQRMLQFHGESTGT
jgi:cellulose biosynthesis protein BcsQ